MSETNTKSSQEVIDALDKLLIKQKPNEPDRELTDAQVVDALHAVFGECIVTTDEKYRDPKWVVNEELPRALEAGRLSVDNGLEGVAGLNRIVTYNKEQYEQITSSFALLHAIGRLEPLQMDGSKYGDQACTPVSENVSWAWTVRNEFDVARNSFWNENEIRYDDDDADIIRMETEIRNFYELVETHGESDTTEFLATKNKIAAYETILQLVRFLVAFFANFDGVVAKYVSDLAGRTKVWELLAYFSAQNYAETIHQLTYARMLDVYIRDAQQHEELKSSIHTIPELRELAEFCQKYAGADDAPLATKLYIMMLMEGAAFAPQFAIIMSLSHLPEPIFKGLVQANLIIQREETQHARMNAKQYLQTRFRLAPEFAQEIATEFADILVRFSKRMFYQGDKTSAIDYVDMFSAGEKDGKRRELPGLNYDDMEQYIKHVTDYWITRVGVPAIFNVENPWEWTQEQGKLIYSNIFETAGTTYQTDLGSKKMNRPMFSEPQTAIVL